MVVVLVTRIARDALRTALEESGENDIEKMDASGASDNQSDVLQPLIVRIDSSSDVSDDALKSLDAVL